MEKLWIFDGLADGQFAVVDGRPLRLHDKFGPVDPDRLEGPVLRCLEGYVARGIAREAAPPAPTPAPEVTGEEEE